MFLSIIIPVYNAEKYLDECLQSCLKQDIDANDYEIICINDGSKDNSLRLLQEYSDKYANIVVIDQPNGGVSSARNKGIETAKGDYIWFVDSDDFIRPNCLKELKKLADEEYDVINFGGYAFGQSLSKEECELLQSNKIESNKTRWGPIVVHIYKLQLILDNNIRFNTKLSYNEDVLFDHDVYTVLKSRKKLKKALYFYRRNPDSAMNTLHTLNSRLKYMDSTVLTLEILKNGFDSGKYYKDSSVVILQTMYKQFLQILIRLNNKSAKYYLKTMSEKGIFETAFLKRYNLPDKNKIIFAYIFRHFNLWFRGTLKKLLHENFVSFLKKILKIKDKY